MVLVDVFHYDFGFGLELEEFHNEADELGGSLVAAKSASDTIDVHGLVDNCFG